MLCHFIGFILYMEHSAYTLCFHLNIYSVEYKDLKSFVYTYTYI